MSLYTPDHFSADPATWQRSLLQSPFCLLISVGPETSFLPLLPDGDHAVIGHLARINPQARALRKAGAAGLNCTAIIAGPHAYVSPRWYQGDAPAVPTWNYEAVRLDGTATVLEGEAAEAVVVRLSDHFEAEIPGEPWVFSKEPEGFRRGMLNGITAFRLSIDTVTSKAKLSQNRAEADQKGVVQGLRRTGRPGDAALADAMTRTLFPTEEGA